MKLHSQLANPTKGKIVQQVRGRPTGVELRKAPMQSKSTATAPRQLCSVLVLEI